MTEFTYERTTNLRILRLADPRRATGGLCGLCDAAATQWHRSSRRSRTDADGLVLAVRCCDVHEAAALAALSAMTIDDVAALVPRPRRAARAAGARSRATRLIGAARAHRRVGAALAGASSAAHGHALMGGYHEMCGEALVALAERLEELEEQSRRRTAGTRVEPGATTAARHDR